MTKGFIEVTREDNNRKVSIAVDKIEYFEECEDGRAFVVTYHYGYKHETINIGFTTVETYAEVFYKIEKAAGKLPAA